MKQVPFGLYEAEVRVPGFEVRREKIGVYQQELMYRLGVVLNYPHSTERPEIAGAVSFPGSRKDLWVRLVSIFGGDVIENAVDHNGAFHLTGAAPGKYILVLLRKETVLATRAIEVLGGSTVVNFTVN